MVRPARESSQGVVFRIMSVTSSSPPPSADPASAKPSVPGSPGSLEEARERMLALGAFLGWLGFHGINPERLTGREWSKLAVECSGFERPNGKPLLDGQVQRFVSDAKFGYRQEQERLAMPAEEDDLDELGGEGARYLVWRMTPEDRVTLCALLEKTKASTALERRLRKFLLHKARP